MYVITRNVQTELVVQKSRFLTSLYRVSTEIEAQAKIKALKKEYWDANHNCTAYIVGIKPRAERSSDDGEQARPCLKYCAKKSSITSLLW